MNTCFPPAPVSAACQTCYSLSDLKQLLKHGTLIAAFRSGAIACDTADLPISAQLLLEKHRRDSSSLLIELRYANNTTRQLVLQQLRATPATLQSWWFPADPCIPALSAICAGTIVDQSLWDQPWQLPASASDQLRLSQLVYNPGQRASFLLETAAGPQFVVKAIRPASFQASLERALTIEHSGLNRLIRVPRLVSYSHACSALLYEYLPGMPIGQLSSAQHLRLRAWLTQSASHALCQIHGMLLPNLPRWSPTTELQRSRVLLEDLSLQHPSIAALQPAFEQIHSYLCSHTYPDGHLTHSDFSARNLLVHYGRPDQHELAVIDWDSAVTGPPERDLAAFLGGAAHGNAIEQPIIGSYQQQSGRSLDRYLMTCFRQYQRILKLCRRTLKDSASATTAEQLALEIAAALQR